MKKIFFGFLLFFSITNSFAADKFFAEKQENDELKTIINTIEIKRISGFGGPLMTYTNLGGDFAFMMGGGGGIIINNMFIGGYGEGLSNSINIKRENILRDIDFGHGGLWIGYEIAHKAVIHPVISARIGWGGVSGENLTNNSFFSDNVFVVSPTISAEINITRFFKMNVGAEYRQTLDVNHTTPLNQSDLSGLGVYMNFIFGWF